MCTYIIYNCIYNCIYIYVWNWIFCCNQLWDAFPETSIATEYQWLEDQICFILFGWPIFRTCKYVSFRECILRNPVFFCPQTMVKFWWHFYWVVLQRASVPKTEVSYEDCFSYRAIGMGTLSRWKVKRLKIYTDILKHLEQLDILYAFLKPWFWVSTSSNQRLCMQLFVYMFIETL